MGGEGDPAQNEQDLFFGIHGDSGCTMPLGLLGPSPFSSKTDHPVVLNHRLVFFYNLLPILLKAPINHLHPGERRLNRVERQEFPKTSVDMQVIIMPVVSHVACALKIIHSLVHAGIYGCHKGEIFAPLADGSGLAVMFRGGEELQIILGRIDFEDYDAALIAGGLRI